jgi:prepilin-type N-terminal cleavage/methylation domain-containing protein
MTPSSVPRPAGRRRGFTLAETMIALGILGVAMLLLTQLAVLLLREHRRDAARQDAQEAAANALEAARACPWDELTPAWAVRQRLPEAVAGRLRDGRLEVRVEPEEGRPHVRRITVEVRWLHDDEKPAPPVRLVGLRSARSAAASGGTP